MTRTADVRERVVDLEVSFFRDTALQPRKVVNKPVIEDRRAEIRGI